MVIIMEVKVGNWKEAKMQDMRAGIRRTLFTGERATVQMSEVQNGHEVTPHTHEYEQIAVVLQGECDFHVAGKVYPMKPGSYVVIPPNVEHNIHVYNSPVPVINMDVWAPRRDDFVGQYEKFLKEQG